VSTRRHARLPPLLKNDQGRPLCRWCKTEVKPPRRTFCSDECVEEYLIRSSPGHVRIKVLARDKGICSMCGVDAERINRIAKKLLNVMYWNSERRTNYFNRYNAVAEKYPWALDKIKSPAYYAWSKVRSTWQADHIIPVAEGGGECGLENYRTLCTQCHKKVTKELHERLKKSRKK
jgi:5-methylcytosine-specific restriction protein A